MDSRGTPSQVVARGGNSIAAGKDVAFNAIGPDSRFTYIENLRLDSGTATDYTLSSLQPPSALLYTIREEIQTQLLTAVRQSVSTTPNLVSLEGIGGTGKSTLAAVIASDHDIQNIFRGGVFWLQIGRDRTGERLSSYLCEVVQALTGAHFAAKDVPLAANALVDCLATREEPSLLVIDDVWTNDQVRDLLRGGTNVTRLVLSRNRLGALAHARTIEVGMMSPEESVQTLVRDLDPASRAAMSPSLLSQLVQFSHRWPVLLTILNAALRESIRQGAKPGDVVDWVTGLLRRGGPSALDGALSLSLEQSVWATLNSTLELVGDDSHTLFSLLCIFAEDVVIPDHLITHYWASREGVSPENANAIIGRLTQLRLLSTRWCDGKPGRVLHDVLRDYLIHQCDQAVFVAMNADLISSWRELFLGNPDSSDWWRVPLTEQFVYEHLGKHLAAAYLSEERNALLLDLRWHAAQIACLGTVLPSVADLSATWDRTLSNLRTLLVTHAALFQRESSPGGLASTLLARVTSDKSLHAIAAAFAADLKWPTLRPEWAMDDISPREAASHLGPIGDVAQSRDGLLLATVSDDRMGLIWDLATGSVILRLQGHAERVRSCSFSPAGDRLLTSGMDGTARVWDARTGESLLVVGREGCALLGSCWSPSGALIAGSFADGTTLVWDSAAGGVVATLKTDHRGGTWDCAFLDDLTLITVGDDGHIRGCILENSNFVLDLWVHNARIRRCAISGDRQRALTASSDSTVGVIDLSGNCVAGYLIGHSDRIRSACFSPTGEQIVTASEDRTVRLWSVHDLSEIHRLQGHADWVGKAIFCKDHTLVSCSGDATIRRWQFDMHKEPQYRNSVTFPRGGDDTASCCFSPDGAVVYFGKVDRAHARAIDGAQLAEYAGHSGRVLDVAADHKRLYTAGSDGRIVAHDLSGTDPQRTCDIGARIWSLAAGRRSHLVASAAEDGILRFHSNDSLRILRQSDRIPGHAMACALNPSETSVCYVGDDAAVHLSSLDLATEATALPVEGLRSLWCCSFSCRGDRLAVAGEPGLRTSIFATASRSLTLTLGTQVGRVTSVSFSCDDRFIATCGDDGYVGIWDGATGEPITGLRLHYPLRRCAWSPTHPNLLAVAGAGGEYLFRLKGI